MKKTEQNIQELWENCNIQDGNIKSKIEKATKNI